MKILTQINYIGGLGADRWIGEGYKDAFESFGHKHFWLESRDDTAARIREVAPALVIIGHSKLTKENLPIFSRFRETGGRVAVKVDSQFDADPEIADALIHHDPADLYFGEVENPWMERFKRVTGKRYIVIANAAHHKLHRPGTPSAKYKCDIVFLGSAGVPKKQEALRTLLFPLRKKYDVKVFGPNWTLKDKFLKTVGFTFRKAGFEAGKDFIQNLRLTVPPEDEPALYSSAKICINIHSRGEDIKDYVILNERTFKIPACGGFELCDFVPPLRNYFTEDEMAMADDKNGDWVKDWFEKIDYYLRHDAERKAIQERGTARALRDHTYLNRVRRLFDALGMQNQT